MVALEVNAFIAGIMEGDLIHDFRRLTTDTDPSLNLDFWLSSGSAHLWHPAQQHPPVSGSAASMR